MTETPIDIPTLQAIVNNFRHCKVLGITVEAIGDRQVTLSLPYSEKIVGNPATGVIHGGALTTLLDSCCGLSVSVALEGKKFAPTLDLRIDYMTAAKPDKTLYARAEAYRVTRNIVFTRGIVYQEDDERPVAHCVGTFMPLDVDVDLTRVNAL